MVVQEIFQRDESLDVEEHSGQPLEIDNDQLRRSQSWSSYKYKFPKELNTDHLKTWPNSVSICLMNWPKIKKKKIILKFCLLLFYTTMNHFSIIFWLVTDSGFYMKTSNDHLSDWTKQQLQSTSQSQTCTKNKRTRSLFGGLLPIWSTTAFWILVKPLPPRSTLNKSMKTGTKNCHNCSWHWSTDWAHFFPMTTPNHTSHNQCF